jgi:uncharacterized protein DUF4440
VLRGFFEALQQDGAAAVAKYYADGAVISRDDGGVSTKSEYIAATRKQLAGNDTKVSEQPDAVDVKFVGDVAIATFVDKMENTDHLTGVQYQGIFREARVFGCDNGAWKTVFRSEIQRPNATRVPVDSERAKFHDYVGHYRMIQNGKMLGDVTVTKKGNILLEAWGKSAPDEILPGA